MTCCARRRSTGARTRAYLRATLSSNPTHRAPQVPLLARARPLTPSQHPLSRQMTRRTRPRAVKWSAYGWSWRRGGSGGGRGARRATRRTARRSPSTGPPSPRRSPPGRAPRPWTRINPCVISARLNPSSPELILS